MNERVHFIMPLKARQVAGATWPLISGLCAESLTAFVSQSDPRFHIHLVVHDWPDLSSLPGDLAQRITVHRVAFPPPRDDAPLTERMLDKARKLAHAYGAIRPDLGSSGAYTVQVDADDLVHRDLTAHLLTAWPKNGVWFEYGLYYDYSLNRAWEIDHFHKVCGTCAALRLRAQDIPDLGALETYTDLADLGHRFWALDIHHGDWPAMAEGAGRPLSALPFPGAVYRINTGANNHGPRRVRLRHRLPGLYRRFQDQGGTHWVHRPDLGQVLEAFGGTHLKTGKAEEAA